MKKYFLPLFILNLLFSLIFASQPQRMFAAGETWTWQANGNITVTGHNLHSPGTIPKNGQGYLEINNSGSPGGYCALSVLPQLAADDKSAVIEGGFNIPGQNPPHAACPASIQKEYWGTTVQIGGTPPNSNTGGGLCPAGQYPFDVTYYDGNADSIPPAPASLTFIIGKQNKTANGTVENGTFGVDVSYTVSFCLAPGTQKVCVQPAQPDFSCSNITMPKAPYAKTFGQRANNSDVNVEITLLNTDQGPFTVSLTGNGINKTAQGQKAANQGTGCSLQVSATFFNIKPGSYQVCFTKNNQCETLNQVAGTPGNVSINVSQTEQNGQSACATGAPSLPPPPSPPCVQWQNGQCTSFSSALGTFTTDPSGFIQKIFAVLLSISGGIALLLIIRAGYQLMVSQGKPEQIQQARDQLIAAIVGLVFLIFSFVFLQLIGFDILHIPGFTDSTVAAGSCQPGSCIQQSLCTAKNPGHCNTNGCPGGQACVQ